MKRTYEKPEIKKVELVMEESVLQSCKGSNIVGPNTAGCAYHPEVCSQMYWEPGCYGEGCH